MHCAAQGASRRQLPRPLCMCMRNGACGWLCCWCRWLHHLEAVLHGSWVGRQAHLAERRAVAGAGAQELRGRPIGPALPTERNVRFVVSVVHF